MLKQLQDRDCAGINPPLDGYSYLTNRGAFSCARRLFTAYRGPAIKVREAGGNTLKDIGIWGNGIGYLDLPSLIAHCGSNNGFIHTWYNQNGSGNDAVNTTNIFQAKIYDSSTGVLLVNGLPCALFDGADDFYTWTPGLTVSTSPDLTVAAVLKPSSGSLIFVKVGGLGSNGQVLRFYIDTAGAVGVADFNGGTFKTWTPVNTVTADLYPWIMNKQLNANLNAMTCRQSYTTLTQAHADSQTFSLNTDSAIFGGGTSGGGGFQFPFKGSANTWMLFQNTFTAAEQAAVEMCLAHHRAM